MANEKKFQKKDLPSYNTDTFFSQFHCPPSEPEHNPHTPLRDSKASAQYQPLSSSRSCTFPPNRFLFHPESPSIRHTWLLWVSFFGSSLQKWTWYPQFDRNEWTSPHISTPQSPSASKNISSLAIPGLISWPGRPFWIEYSRSIQHLSKQASKSPRLDSKPASKRD